MIVPSASSIGTNLNEKPDVEEFVIESIENAKSNRTQIEPENNIGLVDKSACMALADITFWAKVSLLLIMSKTVESAF